jgi:uroporphyrinogen-III synthase
MKQLGVPVDFIAKTPSLDALVDATVKALSKARG